MPEPIKHTFTLVPATQQALAALTEVTGLTRTDCINRAVQVYRHLEEEQFAGKTVLLRDQAGRMEQLRWHTKPPASTDGDQ